MKLCPRCTIEKPVEYFSRNKRKKDGLQTYCKECYSAINADTYKRLPKRRSKILQSNKDTIARNRKFLGRLRRMFGCRFCGENEPVALDFHHIDQTQKDTEVVKLVSYSRLRLKEEIRKCAILCSNCHRKLHAGIEGYEIVV